MSVLHAVRLWVRSWGLDVRRYPRDSEGGQLARLLAANHVDTVIDVGANDGDFGHLLFEAGFRGSLLSFEPLPDAYEKLLRRAARRRRWAVAPRMALGEENGGSVRINVAGNSRSSSILSMLEQHERSAPGSAYIGSQSVPLNRLDAVVHPLLSSGRSLFLKVDTQGFEMPVLRGAAGLMSRIDGLQLEMSLVPLYAGQMLHEELTAWVVERGFVLYRVVPGFSDPKTGRMLQMDCIFFRERTPATPGR